MNIGEMHRWVLVMWACDSLPGQTQKIDDALKMQITKWLGKGIQGKGMKVHPNLWGLQEGSQCN